MLFLAGFGWGKPVPVNARNFKHPHRDEALTALAGPLANLLMAVLAAMPLKYLSLSLSHPVMLFSTAIFELSLVLFLFNMLPIPPLDGSKFLIFLVPKNARFKARELMQQSLPYFVLLLLADLYLGPQLFGFSLVRFVLGQLIFYMKAAIFIVL